MLNVNAQQAPNDANIRFPFPPQRDTPYLFRAAVNQQQFQSQSNISKQMMCYQNSDKNNETVCSYNIYSHQPNSQSENIHSYWYPNDYWNSYGSQNSNEIFATNNLPPHFRYSTNNQLE